MKRIKLIDLQLISPRKHLLECQHPPLKLVVIVTKMNLMTSRLDWPRCYREDLLLLLKKYLKLGPLPIPLKLKKN